jgi:hypothetical protein
LSLAPGPPDVPPLLQPVATNTALIIATAISLFMTIPPKNDPKDAATRRVLERDYV